MRINLIIVSISRRPLWVTVNTVESLPDFFATNMLNARNNTGSVSV